MGISRSAGLVSSLLLAAAFAAAQEPTDDDLKREHEALKQRLAEMERVMAQRGIAPVAAPAEGGPLVAEKKDGRPMGEVVVTATRGEAGTKTTGSTISTVTGTEIAQQNSNEMMEPLRGVPGLHVVRTGGRGGITSVFTRGTNQNHTLFLVEGFEITRDGGTFFELSSLSTDATSGIEVLRGPQSALYGSDAVAGVINFRVRRGDGPPRALTTFEAGSYATNREKIDIQGGDDTFGFSLVASRLEQSNGPIDHTDFEVSSVTGRFDYDFSDTTSLMALVVAEEDDLNIGTQATGPRFLGVPEPDASAEKDSELFGLDFTHWFAEWMEAHIVLSRYTLNRDAFDFPTALDPGNFQQLSEYTKGIAHLYGRFYPCEWDTITLGIEFEDQEQEQESNLAPAGIRNDRDNRAVYMQHELALWDMVYLTPGARYESSSSFGVEWTYRIAGAVWIDQTGTKPRASIGTAVVEPSLFNSFDVRRGTPGLQPERNEAWDFGVDQWLCDDRVRLSATYFHNRLDELIGNQVLSLNPVTTGRFVNQGRARTAGIEAEAHWDVARGLLREDDALSTSASYTWTETEVLHSNIPNNASFKEGGSLLRRPTNVAHLNIDWTIAETAGVNLDFNYFGSRKDRSFAAGRPPREVVNGYLRVDLAGFWCVPWVKGLRVVGRAENLFDKDYDEAYGFPAPGFNVLGGLEYRIDF